MSKLMKSNSLIYLAIAAIILVAGVFYLRQTGPSTPTPDAVVPNQEEIPTSHPQKTVDVVAQNGSFSPNVFTVGQNEDLNLNVTAIDKDYKFSIKGYSRLDTTFIKGSTRSQVLDKLGVGTYTYTCGSGCKGTVTIELEED